ncbi:MAG TPA: hypothetical protein VFZ58_05410 [Candidatus Saccharimonadales bacterium]
MTTLSLFSYRSKRRDEFRSASVVGGIINKVKATGRFQGINHIGFCYKVSSQTIEAKRLIDIANNAGSHIYREPSSDDGDWLFVGDISGPKNSILEFIPHEGETDDKWIDYWLPHIQFDVDTGLSPTEIESIIKEFIDDPEVPYSIQIDDITYIQRVNLGCIDGVNIFLDLATNNRNPAYRKTWTKLG